MKTWQFWTTIIIVLACVLIGMGIYNSNRSSDLVNRRVACDSICYNNFDKGGETNIDLQNCLSECTMTVK